MSLYVDNAIFSRWTAKSLHTSIAALYPGGDDDAAAPETADLPRAQYWATSDSKESESLGTIIRVKNYIFTVWGSNYETVGGYLESIEAAFLNAEKATTSALAMSAIRGTILGTHLGDKSIEQLDTDVWRGRLGYEVRYSRLNQIPS